jgi:hypothetical protein
VPQTAIVTFQCGLPPDTLRAEITFAKESAGEKHLERVPATTGCMPIFLFLLRRKLSFLLPRFQKGEPMHQRSDEISMQRANSRPTLGCVRGRDGTPAGEMGSVVRVESRDG